MCDDLFDINDARVVCRHIGYPGAVQYHKEAYFGQGSGPILLDNLACYGTETVIFDCPRNDVGDHNCKHNEDVGVECRGIAVHANWKLLQMLYFIVCADLPDPVNGSVVTIGNISDRAIYTCDNGYELFGTNNVTCQPSGNWSGSPPTCEG